ncbi:UNVERIFIED_CONTAM: putative polygalacturonase [Sesamum calycinum]|uniref:Polygalacturonase n=1 Tax=Sesamum calycinum TaxID=2727403 RepID=A0AAW2M1B9_9LAMI
MHCFDYSILLCIGVILLLSINYANAELETCSWIVPMRYRYDKISITDFGGVGDGVTLNTKAFRAAIYRIEHLRRRGGTLLYIPPGEYLTGPFNLTSHMTLYLARGAVIKATMDTEQWPLVAPLPSYGRGRERPGGSNVVIRYVTILAPADSPNTDGIDPDSSSHVCIEDSYISTGDDLIAVKSGWDEYGIAYGRPSHGITIRRVTGSSPFAGIAVGSETSGGVEDVLAEHINLFNMGVGIHLKTNIGRGGVIRNITVSDVYMEDARKGIKISGDVGDHPDEYYNRNALPVLKDVVIKNIWGERVQQPGLIQGLKNAPFTGICLSNIHLRGARGPRNLPWQCSDVRGAAVQVSPWPCSQLTSHQQTGACSSSI